jgi:hypothetical protein
MQTEPTVTPTAEDIDRVWHTDRRLSLGTALVYMGRIKLFRTYCAEHGLVECEELTLERVNRFIGWYARRRNLDPRSLGLFRSALRSLNRVVSIRPSTRFRLPALEARAFSNARAAVLQPC